MTAPSSGGKLSLTCTRMRLSARRASDVFGPEMLGEFADESPGEGRRASARVGADRQVAHANALPDIVKSPRSGAPASQTSTRCARASATTRALTASSSVAAIDQRGFGEIARLVGALLAGSSGCAHEIAQRIADPFRDDRDRKPGIGHRLGFTSGDISSADDYRSTAVGPKRDRKHRNVKRVQRPAAKNRLAS